LRVIAVDTSSERASVALVEGREVRGEVRLTTSLPSVVVLPAVEFVLRSSGLTAADVDGYAATMGPGSFTGVRVGLSTIQGLALGSGRPCLGLSTLDVLAAGVAGEADSLVAMADAFRDEVFVGRYDRDARPLGPPSRERPQAAMAELPVDCVLTGEGARRYEVLIHETLPGARIVQRDPFLAARLGLLAEPLLEAGRGVPARDLRPLYLRDADVRPAKP
jgi:tRNA threonylcarbamoyladenosine biosynthesis protein TsaB